MVSGSFARGATRRGSARVAVALVLALVALVVPQAGVARAATADKIAPAIAAAGTGVAISGTALEGTTGVTFLGGEGDADDVAAEHFIVVDTKKVVVQIPRGAKTGPVAVTSDAGTVLSVVPTTIVPVPVIDNVSDPALPPGATLTINGQHLLGVKKTIVLFGAKKAAPLATSTATSLQVVVPTGVRGGPLDLAVVTEGGTAYEDFYMAPAIKAVAPLAGTTAGGTVVTITGSGFSGADAFDDDPATADVDESRSGVTIGGQSVRKIIAVSDTEIVAVTPAGATGAAPVVVHTTDGHVTAESVSPVTFAYQPLPSVRTLSQDWNPVTPAPAEPVTATGENLTHDTKVYVGTLQATDVVADMDAGTLTFTPPAGTKAAVSKVTFVNTAGTVPYSQTLPFTYTAAPVVAKLTPATGPAGTSVTIAGTGFVSGTTVEFGGVQADCVIVSPLLVRCTAPAGTETVDVVVTNGVGTSSAVPASIFTYTSGTLAPAPPAPQAAVTGIAPIYGATGSTVALKGVNLNLVTRVEFTGTEQPWVEAAKFAVVAPGRLVATVPAGVASGPLRLTTPAGRVTSGIFNYMSSVRPSISSIDVVGDATYGVAVGDMLQIKGAGLVVGTVRPVVTVGGKPASLLSRPVPTARTILVKVPASVGGRERVTVTTPLGSATAEASVYFTPQIKTVKPVSYSRTGGLPVTIAGSGFTGVADLNEAAGGRLGGVMFGGVAVSKLVVMSDKEIVATTAEGSASVDFLVVRSQHDTWIGSSDETVRATNLPEPTITSISPNTQVLGTPAVPVTITGTNLRTSSTVMFGAVPGEVQSAAEDGTTLVVVPPLRSTPAKVALSVTNVVLGEDLTATVSGGFRYVPQPSITDITPSVGFTGVVPPQVTISGANLRSLSVVRFGDAVATVESVNGAGNEMVVTPPVFAAAGAVDVTVTNVFDDEELTATVIGGYTYQLRAYPTVEAVTPDNAVAGAATSAVTITGTHLRSDSTVLFGNAPATVVSAAQDGTSLVVVPPTGAAGTVAVTVTNTIVGDALSGALAGGFRYLPTPTINSVTPDSSTIGVAPAAVTINGANLQANSVVRFGGTAAAIQSVNGGGTSLTATPPSLQTPGPVDVTVTNIVDGEELTATLVSGYTYLADQSPTISAVTPSTGTTGQSNGEVIVTGTKLRADTVVRFGSSAATTVSVNGDGTSMVVRPPVATTDGYVAVSVTNTVDRQNFAAALANAYRYVPTPSIASVSPATGMTGATPANATITGTNLRLNTVVRFGSSAATVVSAASDGSSMVVTPPTSNTVGFVDVTVTNVVDGTQELTAAKVNAYRYDLVPATITGTSASTALPGTQVTLTGTSFLNVSAVHFGATPATFSVANATTIFATVPVTPSGAQGTATDITVVNGTGEASTAEPPTADDWTWASHPLITAMSPATGVQGSQVTLTGSGFNGATAVRFGSIDATFTVVDDTTVTAVVPTTPSAGSVADVTVVARGLTSPERLTPSVNDWTWAPIAAITKITPNPASAGSTVTVTGRNFTNVRTVTVNNTDVTASVVVQDSTTLTFTVPPRPGGGAGARTDKPVYIVNGSGAQSTADIDPATGKAANLFTWL